MIRRGPGVLVLLVLLPVLLAARDVRAQERTPVVRALLFYSPTCPHCEELINNRLPPLLQKYGESLDVIGINVATQGGLRLYQAAASWYMIGPDRQGVPTLIVGSRVLVGQVEIPAVLPQLTDSALAHGGIDWP
jgi:thiol-disulfide isomerase/thioredoxin